MNNKKFSPVAAMEHARMEFHPKTERVSSAFRRVAHATGTHDQVAQVIQAAKAAGWKETYMGMVKGEDGSYMLVHETPALSLKERGQRLSVSAYE